ncbi:hypothetical protein GQ457_07G001300 [Hibiscus cannabinus]
MSDLEKRKKDCAVRREKKLGMVHEESELSGRSLSDSDLVSRWEFQKREARKVLSLGKRLGVQIIGDEEQAVEDIARLVEN